MNPEQPRESDVALRQLLHEWKVTTPVPPGLQNQIWKRIDAAERRPQASSRLMDWRGFALRLLSPTFAGSYVAVLLMAGLAAGYWKGRSTNTKSEEQLSELYVHRIDPYQSGRH